jgi:excinuclease ABC subunit C
MLEFDSGREFDATRDEEFFAALPSRPGVVLVEMAEAAAEPYLARTADIRRAAERLLRAPEAASKRLNLRAVAARIRYRATGSKFEQSLALYHHARKYLPGRYRALLRLRPPVVLKVNLRNAYPRCYVARGIRGDEGFYFGPFASRRAAQSFAEGFLDLFKIRRCQIKIRRDPQFPGCIYSEMKMCLAPCFGGCTREDYAAEVGRVLETLATRGGALTARFEQEREAASEALDFERAAALHKRLEKVSAALRGLPELVRRIESLDAVILQRAAEEKAVAVFPLLGGLLAEPLFLRFGEISSQPRSVEAILRTALQPQMHADERGDGHSENKPEGSAGGEAAESSDGHWRAQYGLRAAPADLAEHLALVARWFYSKPREGEIFFREGEWPYRRILRACGRLLAPEGSSPGAGVPPPAAPK